MTALGVVAGFEPVVDAFDENFASRGEVGAAFCAYVEGRRVADLWGGEARPGVPWDGDTMAVVFSTTKGMTAAAVQWLVTNGQLDLERPIADVWPAFAANGKEEITLTQVLTHTSGVVSFPRYEHVVDDLSWWGDLDRVAASFEAAAPSWEPGSAHGYHAASLGFIINEVTRRATGRTIGEVLRSQIAQPLDLDVHIGLPAHLDGRVATLVDPPRPTDPVLNAYLSLFTPEHLTGRSHLMREDKLFEVGSAFNDPEVWPFEFPSGGGIASARGIAGLYDVLARGGGETFAEASIAEHARERVRGPDLVLVFETAFGLGYGRPTSFIHFGPSTAAFGHGGLGGSAGFADPDNQVAIGYVMNALHFPTLGEVTRMAALVDALYGCLS